MAAIACRREWLLVGRYAVRGLLRRPARNGADRAALKPAMLGRPVKLMKGGISRRGASSTPAPSL